MKLYSEWAPLACSTVVSACIIILLYNTYWFPQDEGVMAYVADQILKGKIFGVDVSDIHPGYHAFLNAFLFRIFGEDLVVLRYPLALASVLQASMTTVMTRRHGFIISTLAGIATTCTGFVQFLNPSINWYTLFFAFCAVFVLTEIKPSAKRDTFLGFLAGLCFMFRHPSGIFLAFGILTALLYPLAQQKNTDMSATEHNLKNTTCYKATLLCILVFLSLYSCFMFEPLAFVLFGAPAILFLAYFIYGRGIHNGDFIRAVLPSIIGGIVAVLPMLIYQMIYGDLILWFTSSFLFSSKIIGSSFFFEKRYWEYPYTLASVFLFEYPSLIIFLRFCYWIMILSTPLFLSALLCRAIKHSQKQAPFIPPAVFIALFFGYVSFYYQNRGYLYFSLGLYIIAVLPLLDIRSPVTKAVTASALLFISGCALFFESHLTSPLLYGIAFKKSTIPHASLYIYEDEDKTFNALLKTINTYSQPDDPLYVFPLNPEIYFLSGRKNISPHYASFFFVTSDATYNALLDTIERNKTPLLIANTDNSYWSAYDQKLLEDIRNKKLPYALVASPGEFQVFKRLDTPAPD